MKTKMKLFITFIACILSLNLSAQKLDIFTSGNRTTFELGEAVELKLILSELNGKLTATPNDKVSNLDFMEFKKSIVVTLTDLGEYNLGPYELTIYNKIITSNTIKVSVIPPIELINNQDTLITIIAPKEASKKTEFDIIINSNVKLFTPKRIDKTDKSILSGFQKLKLKNNKMIEQINSSYSSSMKFKDGISTYEYSYSFKVKALKKGIFTLNSESFTPVISGHFYKVLIIIK